MMRRVVVTRPLAGVGWIVARLLHAAISIDVRTMHFEMLSLSKDEDENAVRQHVAKFGLPWKQAWIGTRSDIPWDYHALGAGYYIVVGSDGVIRRVKGTFDELRATIAECLESGGL